MGWLFPLAFIGMGVATFQHQAKRPLNPAHLALMLWFSWTVCYGVVYSYAGGFFHFYYLATMAPPLAALAGIGVVSLWGTYLQTGWRALLLPGALLVLLLRRAWGGPAQALAAGVLGLGLVALLEIPLAWVLSSVLVPGQGILPSADLATLLAGDRTAEVRTRSRLENSADLAKLVAFLRSNRQGERYLLATSSATLAAPIIIQTGEAVMATGGFHGLDPILTPETLSSIVDAKQVRFVMLGDLSVVSRRLGADTAGRPIADWVRANGKLVAPALWRSDAPAAGRPTSRMRLLTFGPTPAASRSLPRPSPLARAAGGQRDPFQRFPAARARRPRRAIVTSSKTGH